MSRKPWRPLTGIQAIADDVLERWGKEVGPDHLMYAKLHWPAETMLSRIRREGAGAGQHGAPPVALSEESAVVDKAVRAVDRKITREVLRLWYCSRTRENQEACAARAGVGVRTFQFHLHVGRAKVADLLGLGM